jgi:translation initiation factor 4E
MSSTSNHSNQKDPNANTIKLNQKYAFYYRKTEDSNQTQSKQPLDKVEYESQVKKISEFDTNQDFWAIFQHLRKPDSCKPGIEFHMFKYPVKPMWEDENNKNGGKITIKLTKGYTTIIWEEMIFALIGEDVLPYDIKVEINGIVVTTKKEYNTLQIWIKNFETNINNKIELCIRDLLQIPPEVNLEFRQFNKNNKK